MKLLLIPSSLLGYALTGLGTTATEKVFEITRNSLQNGDYLTAIGTGLLTLAGSIAIFYGLGIITTSYYETWKEYTQRKD